MKINPNIFRGYDLRGLVNTDLSEELMRHLGLAYGTYSKRHGITTLIVGRDCRASGPLYSKALIEGILDTGVNVIDIGMTLVGTFYWSQHYLKQRGGAYISASHNPPEYNGIKFANDYSETLVSDGIQELKRMVEEEDYERASQKGTLQSQDINPVYIEDVSKRFAINKKLRVVVDPSNSTAGTLAPKILRAVGCEVIEHNCTVDPSFPLGVADPTSSVIAKRLAREVTDAKADVGFSYDADGDRIGIVDEKGNIIWNDVLLAIFAIDVLREHPGSTIMYNILCSKVVEETIVEHGGKPFVWRVGHSFLKKKNQEVKAAFIGELSGHFFFSKDFYNHDDGLYSTLRLIRFISGSGEPLSESVERLPHYISSPEIKIYCPDTAKVSTVAKISPELKKRYPDAVILDGESAGDGIRLDFDDGMIVVRYSQNGPYLTIKYEAKTAERYDKFRNIIKELLKKYPEIDWSSKINLNLEALEN